MKRYIKNMVCNRCIIIVEQVLEGIDFTYENIQNLNSIIMLSLLGK